MKTGMPELSVGITVSKKLRVPLWVCKRSGLLHFGVNIGVPLFAETTVCCETFRAQGPWVKIQGSAGASRKID